MKEFDFLVFIGRFQPYHKGHLSVIEAALAKADQVIVLCGSAHQPRSIRNPWTFDERVTMILDSVSAQDAKRLHVAPLMDSLYNDEAWVKNVQMTVNGIIAAYHPYQHRAVKVGLIGHAKDKTSYYLNLFPQWSSAAAPNYGGLSATPLRDELFREGCMKGDALPLNVNKFINEFITTETFTAIQAESSFIDQYKRSWESAPYAPTFVTVDAVVVQSGHVLMIERKARPGKGLLALPGGFIEQDEKLIDACLRELREETRLKVPAPVLKGSVRKQRVFDDPNRSFRGRTITHAFYIELEPSSKLPAVKGGDDAKCALWVPLSELHPGKVFEDHFFIIENMTGL